MNDENLKKLGFDDFFQKGSSDYLQEEFSYARVTEVNKNSYVVSNGNSEMSAELSGKFLFNADAATDFPTVGDWVTVQTMDNYTQAIVHSILPRKTLIKRKTSGNRIDFQLIASNIDYGLVVQSADRFNFNLLDRYLVMLNESGIEPVVIISKIDLSSTPEIDALIDSLSKLSNKVLAISNNTEGGTDALADILIPGKTYCLLGQSGVGKSSLLNRLLGSCVLDVGKVREKDGRGRHTTARRQLVCIDSGSIFIDTPGIRELGNFQVDKGLDKTFDEFSSFALQCRFSDCSHTHEKGCAVIAAVENGDIEEDRYRNLLKLKKESEFYDLSYQERRKKDKSFGKMIKNYKKMKGNK
ncbi:MAG: ribosome small subunit-dependent GTPase A [Planctomycetota bacterium]|jgi:ribosome biogenesis GTPase